MGLGHHRRERGLQHRPAAGHLQAVRLQPNHPRLRRHSGTAGRPSASATTVTLTANTTLNHRGLAINSTLSGTVKTATADAPCAGSMRLSTTPRTLGLHGLGWRRMPSGAYSTALPPGTYKLCVSSPTLPASPTFWYGGTTWRRATTVTLTANTTLNHRGLAINSTLSGTVTDDRRGAPCAGSIAVYDATHPRLQSARLASTRAGPSAPSCRRAPTSCASPPPPPASRPSGTAGRAGDATTVALTANTTLNHRGWPSIRPSRAPSRRPPGRPCRGLDRLLVRRRRNPRLHHARASRRPATRGTFTALPSCRHGHPTSCCVASPPPGRLRRAFWYGGDAWRAADHRSPSPPMLTVSSDHDV